MRFLRESSPKMDISVRINRTDLPPWAMETYFVLVHIAKMSLSLVRENVLYKVYIQSIIKLSALSLQLSLSLSLSLSVALVTLQVH